VYRTGKAALTLWRVAAVAALLTIIVALSFPAIPGITACDKAGSWVAFQMVSSVAAVNAMIGPDCAKAFALALRRSMWLDSLVFIPAYGAFLGLVLGALRRRSINVWLAGIASLAIGIAGDQVEGFRLLAIIEALPGTETMIDSVNTATLVKKLGLSVTTGLIGLLLTRERGAMRLLGFIIATGGLAVLAASVSTSFGDAGEQISQYGLLVAWLALAIVAAFKGFWPARAG
jgi:hypothetical protein